MIKIKTFIGLCFLAPVSLFAQESTTNKPAAKTDSTAVSSTTKSSEQIDELAYPDSLMEGVTVVAQRPIIKMETDKMTYDVEQDPDSKTDNMIEMLRKVPLVTVDAEENIEVNGSSKFKIYVNGKPNNMMSNNPKDVLRSMPASSIKRIEVITNPGAKYDAEGVTGILNIITQGKRMQGYNLSLTSTARNTGVGGGLYTTVQKGKFTTTVNYNYNHFMQASSSEETERILSGSEDNYRFLLKGSAKPRGNVHNGSLEASYEIDTLQLISVSADMYNVDYKFNNRFATNMYSRSGAQTYGYDYGYSRNASFGWLGGNVDYQRSFHKPDRLLTLSYRLSNSPSTTDLYTSYYDVVGTVDNLKNRYSDNETSSMEHTFQIDYTDPITKNQGIEVGAKYILRRNTSDGYQYTAPVGSENYIYIDSLSSEYAHNQDILAAYLSYNYKWRWLSAKTGARYEHTNQKIKYYLGDHSNFGVNFDDIVPSASVSFTLGEKDKLRLSYDMRLSRPGIEQLDPYVDRSVPTSISYGNSNLDTEKSHNFGLNYAHFTQKLYLSVTASHSFVNNSIERYDSLDVNEIMNSTYANIGQRRTTSLSTYFSWNPKTGTRIYSNNSLSYTHQVCDEMNLKNYGFTYNGSLGVQQTLFWDLRTSLNGGGSTKRYGLQGNSSGYLYYSLSLSRDFLKKKINVSIFGNNFLQPRRTYNRSTKGVGFTTYSKSSYYQASYGISVSYRIGKLQASVKKARRTITNDDVKSTGNGGVTGAGGGVGAQ